MKISILLPYKENFSPIYAGAVSLFVKDTTKISKFKKYITIPQLYTQSIQISAQKIKLKGIYNAQYEKELLTKLWQSQKINSQNSKIENLDNLINKQLREIELNNEIFYKIAIEYERLFG